MNAMQKVAWTNLLISVAAVVTAILLYPWLGNGATGAFGLLGFTALGILFSKGRGQGQTVVDERDREIDQKAIKWGIFAAWQALLLTLIAVTVWSGLHEQKTVSVMLLSWAIWIDAAICFAVKGLVGILSYRSPTRAT